MRQYKSDRPFQIANTFFLILVCLTMVSPMIHVVAVSMSSVEFANAKVVYLWPRGFNLEVYRQIAGFSLIWNSMGVSVYITAAGTLLALALSASISYSLSRPGMVGRKAVTQGILVTFIFTAPLIPSYLVVRSLGMENRLASLIVPGALGAFYVFIMKTFFQGISSELFDAGKIDGCSEFGIFVRIVLPLSKAVLATIALFHAVGQWNSYFSALIFIRDKKLYPIQLVLRNLVVDAMSTAYASTNLIDLNLRTTPEQMQAGIIVFATVPILIVYPFLQKYFVKGAMLGSLKG
jgi:putative aldouronate transport system permease protein